MCTTGALRLGPDEYLLFKNKDFGRSSFDDRLVLEPEVFGIEGITTWAGDDPDRDQFSGFSIGANEHGLMVCDSNVQTLPDHANYDCLVEIALREGTDVESAIDAVRRTTQQEPYLWANLVLVDDQVIAAVDVRGQTIAVTRADDRIARSNHHVVFGEHPDDDDVLTSIPRLQSASRRLDRAACIDDIFVLQASHDHGDSGVCNHMSYDTVYSYVLHHRQGDTNLFVVKGQPCLAEERLELGLPLGPAWSQGLADDFRAAFPSSRAVSSA